MYEIAHVEKAGGHPVTKFLAKLLPELEAQGLQLQTHIPTAISWDQQAVYAHDHTKIIAAIQFSTNDWNRTVNTGWSYTLPEFRGKGINTALIKRVEEIAKAQGYRKVIRETSIHNSGARRSFEKAGYKRTTVVYTKEILADFEFIDMNHLGKT